MKPFWFLFLSICISVVGQLLFKHGTNVASTAQKSGLMLFTSPSILAGLVAYGVSALLYIWSLKFIPLSVAYPSISLGYVFVIGLSVFFLSESLTVYKCAGALLIIAGVSIIWK